VLIRLSSNPKVHQVIDIIVVDIPKVYGLFLGRGWSEQLHGYFTTDWSHLWLPENDKPNKIKVNRECYLKFTVTYLNDPNEPFTPSTDSPEVQGMDTFFGNFMAETSAITNPEQQSEIVAYMQPAAPTQWSHAPDKIKFGLFILTGQSPKKKLVQAALLLI
jgi:hypothetical protein